MWRMNPHPTSSNLSRQQVGNIGLYYVAYRLTREGFKVFPTIRNAKGADIYVLDKHDEKRSISIQVKTSSTRDVIQLGAPTERNEEFLFLVVGVGKDVKTNTWKEPSMYFAPMPTVMNYFKSKEDDQGWGQKKTGRKKKNTPRRFLPREVWQTYSRNLDDFPRARPVKRGGIGSAI